MFSYPQMPDSQFLLGIIYLFLSSSAMICVAVFGYFMAQVFFEIHASKIQSSTAPDGGRSRTGPVWEINRDWDGSEETQRDGD